MSRKTSRRQFLKTAAAVAAPTLIPASALGLAGRPAPSERINMGFIGVGSQGSGNLNNFIGQADVQILAVCDVHQGWENKYGREPNKKKVEARYAEAMKSGAYKGCDAYTDFRELCARKDIDAICISTPDHWHALTALEALKSGKDVYCEKPITHLWAEGRRVADAVKKHGRIWQTGSQQRSEGNFRRAVELVRNGVIGKLQHVEVGLPKGHAHPKNAKVQEPPKEADYDFWCGPSPKLPFIPERFIFHWRWNMAYGAGQLMDWIGHHNDIAHWGMGMDESGPVEVEAKGFTYPEDKSVYDAAIDYEIHCAYANGVTTRITNKNPMGTKWIGTDGWVYVDRGRFDASNKDWLKKDFNAGPFKAYASPGHHRNFIEGIKSRKACAAPAETAFRSATPGFLGLLSQKVGRKIKWDPAAEKVIGDAEAEKHLEINYREPWKA